MLVSEDARIEEQPEKSKEDDKSSAVNEVRYLFFIDTPKTFLTVYEKEARKRHGFRGDGVYDKRSEKAVACNLDDSCGSVLSADDNCGRRGSSKIR